MNWNTLRSHRFHRLVDDAHPVVAGAEGGSCASQVGLNHPCVRVRAGDKNPNLNLFLEEKQVFPLRKSSAFGLVRKGEINFDKI